MSATTNCSIVNASIEVCDGRDARQRVEDLPARSPSAIARHSFSTPSTSLCLHSLPRLRALPPRRTFYGALTSCDNFGNCDAHIRPFRCSQAAATSSASARRNGAHSHLQLPVESRQWLAASGFTTYSHLTQRVRFSIHSWQRLTATITCQSSSK